MNTDKLTNQEQVRYVAWLQIATVKVLMDSGASGVLVMGSDESQRVADDALAVMEKLGAFPKMAQFTADMNSAGGHPDEFDRLSKLEYPELYQAELEAATATFGLAEG